MEPEGGPPAAGDPTRWIASGAAWLAGWPDGPGLVPAGAVLARIARLGAAAGADPWVALTARASVAGLTRRGQVSCGGGTRLVRAADGWVAASLVRPDDLDAVPAWLEIDRDPGPDPWPTIVDEARRRSATDLVTQGALLGLPVAAVGERLAAGVGPSGGGTAEGGSAADETAAGGLPGRRVDLGPAARGPRVAPLVVDLSSLWAGPLCARVLAEAGATVVKVESTERPDGARRGPAAFFDHLHAGHRAVALRFTDPEGQRRLGELVRAADVVIEASRPRALAQLGLAPGDLGPDGPTVWVSITGHGRSGAVAARVGFGDDAAAAGGLVAWTADGPVFGGDAIADPLTGLAAAAAVRRALTDAASATDAPRRCLLDVSLAEVAAWVAGPHLPRDFDRGSGRRSDQIREENPEGVRERVREGVGWAEVADPPPPPPLPPPPGPGPALGADTAEVLASLSRAR